MDRARSHLSNFAGSEHNAPCRIATIFPGDATISSVVRPAVERNFGTAKDRLVKSMRVAGVKTLEEANEYLTNDYLVWWEREMTMAAANPDDAHRPLEKSHNLAGVVELCGRPAGAAGLHIPLGWQAPSDRPSGGHNRIARATVRVEHRLEDRWR